MCWKLFTGQQVSERDNTMPTGSIHLELLLQPFDRLNGVLIHSQKLKGANEKRSGQAHRRLERIEGRAGNTDMSETWQGPWTATNRSNVTSSIVLIYASPFPSPRRQWQAIRLQTATYTYLWPGDYIFMRNIWLLKQHKSLLNCLVFHTCACQLTTLPIKASK